MLGTCELVAEVARTRRSEDLLPPRQALEAVLGIRGDRLAFIEADKAFHLAIARMAANRVLCAFLQTLWQMLVPAKLNLPLSSDNRQVTDRAHQELFQSIVAGDAERARSVMRDHIEQGRVLLLQYVRTLPHVECAEDTSAVKTPTRKRSGGKA